MLNSMLMLLAGLTLLLAGAEGLVRGSSALAFRLGMRPLLIGMTVVAFGTSMPEMVVSLQAALEGKTGLSIGNVIGSNISNLGLILGLSAVIRPLGIQIRTIRMDIPVMIGSSVLFYLCIRNDGIQRTEGIAMLSLMIFFVVFSVVQARRERVKLKPSELGVGDIRRLPAAGIALLMAGGLAGLLTGGRLLIWGATDLARHFGLSETVIGLTIVALGTSLPEMATSVIASIRKESDIAVGNIIGSNIFNTLAIPGLTAMFRPLPLSEGSMLSFGIMTGLSVLCLPFMKSGFRLNRFEGCFFLVIYLAYLLLLFV
jgi:cation:H+ antiporter